MLHGDMSPKHHVFYITTVYLKLYAITKFIEKYKKKTAGKGSYAEETYKTKEPKLLRDLALKKLKTFGSENIFQPSIKNKKVHPISLIKKLY